MKQIKLLIAKIPGFKIIGLCTAAAVIFWIAVIGHYYNKSKELEIQQFQEYMRQHADEQAQQAATVEGAQDSLKFEKETHRKMAEFYMERKQYKSAIPHFERVIERNNIMFLEDNKDFCLSLAEAYINARRMPDAIALLNRLREVMPEEARILQRLAEACFYSGDRTQAAEDLREALKKDPKNTASMILLARIYSIDDHTRKDIPDLLKKAISINPRDLQGYYYYGVYLSDRGEYTPAEENFKAALKLEPFHSPSLARLGMVYYYGGNVQKAKEMYELTLSINKTDYNTMYNLGELYLTSLNDPVNAYVWFRKSAELEPTHFPAIKKLGVLALNNRNYKEACFWFEKGEALRNLDKKYTEEKITTDAELVDILIMHGTALESLGRKEDAKIMLRKALDEDPLNQIARHKLQLLQLNG